jgi:hypothetical protein
MMNPRETRLNYVRIHQSTALHDADCKDTPHHYRVTRPLGYSPSTPGHLDVSARQGHYTDACCATQAASVIRERLVGKGYGKLSELDVQVWP